MTHAAFVAAFSFGLTGFRDFSQRNFSNTNNDFN